MDSLGHKYYGPDTSVQNKTFDTFVLRNLSMTLNDHLAMYSTDDLAQIFNSSSRHIRRLVFRGDFPKPVKIGRLCRWLHDDVTRWLTKGSDECKKPINALSNGGTRHVSK